MLVASIGTVSENDRRVDYLEFLAPDIPRVKRFYESAFGWAFTDYGPDYTSFNDGRLSGGFSSDQPSASGAPLTVIFADDLEVAERRVAEAGGKIVRPTYSFPGGRRFHFTDPAGNELAVWSDKEAPS